MGVFACVVEAEVLRRRRVRLGFPLGNVNRDRGRASTQGGLAPRTGKRNREVFEAKTRGRVVE